MALLQISEPGQTPDPHQRRIAVGIDLGTTHSLVASVRNGVMTQPVYGGFNGGHGEFFGHDSLDGRAIFVRFVISKVTNDSWRFEQAYSEDGGRTWETNWVATDTRVPTNM